MVAEQVKGLFDIRATPGVSGTVSPVSRPTAPPCRSRRTRRPGVRIRRPGASVSRVSYPAEQSYAAY